ncbi:MAG: DNA mismatch repair protein MutS [Chloroflexaceae bacterium]|nr:DNA mismatch repair protein MutS [Chloroflexaceae bacterium]
MAKTDLHVWYRQYQKLKAQNPDAILLYRLGDFYEVFDDDAKLVAELLDVTLTRKECATEKKTSGGSQRLYCPMAGMPYHAVESYVARLVNQGYRVAVAEQLSETPSSKSDTRPRSIFAAGVEPSDRQRGLVHREIVRILTPGTVIDPSMLSAGRNNYLAAVIADGPHIGLSYADLSTGEFAVTEFHGSQAVIHLQGELERLGVSEVLVPDDERLQLPGLSPAMSRLTHDLAPMTKQERETLLPHERVARRLEQESTAQWAHGYVTALPAWCWEPATARDTLLRQFGTQSLAGFGLDQRPLATRAAGAVLHYVQDTQRRSASQITTLRAYTTGAFMALDPQTRRNLELLEGSEGKTRGSLVGVLDHTGTPMGARLLRRWLSQPLVHLGALHQRQEAVACCVEQSLLRAELRQALKSIGDMERVVNRVMQGGGVATPRDLVSLRQALRTLPAVIAAVSGQPALMCLEADEPTLGQVIGQARRGGTTAPADSQPLLLTEEQQKAARRAAATTPLAAVKLPGASAHRGPAPRVAGDDLFGDENEAAVDAPEGREVPAPSEPSSEPPSEPPSKAGQTTATSETRPLVIGRQAAPAASPFDPSPCSCAFLDPCVEALELLEQALDDDPPALLGASNYLRGDGEGENGEKPARRVIRPGYDQRMDQVVTASREAQHYINTLEGLERERTGIKSLKVDYNKVFGYFISLPRSYSNQVPPHYERKQTLVNAERYITVELKEYENVVVNAQQRLVEYERDAFGCICAELLRHSDALRSTARTLASLDVVAALAEAAVRGNYTRPVLNEGTSLRITGGRHPVIEQALADPFVPNDTQVDTNENQILLITGPNMAGKSTVLRQVALIVLMAQIGSFVPAEAAEVGLVDRVFTRIGAQDDLAAGRSTFMVEMTETASLLLQSSPRSLIILDEVGRGTSTYDGMAIARAVVEYLHHEPRLGCRTLFATHYHELTDLEDILPRVKNYHMAALEQGNRVVFLYELRRGRADRSYGIHVAELAGIPPSVIRRARELLAELEQNGTGERSQPAAAPGKQASDRPKPEPEQRTERRTESGEAPQLSLFDVAPNPVVEYLRRLNVNELTPLEALNKLYHLQKIARTGVGANLNDE